MAARPPGVRRRRPAQRRPAQPQSRHTGTAHRQHTVSGRKGMLRVEHSDETHKRGDRGRVRGHGGDGGADLRPDRDADPVGRDAARAAAVTQSNALRTMRKFQDAIDVLKPYENDNNFDVLIAMGQAIEGFWLPVKRIEAIEWYKKAVALSPNNKTGYTRLAGAYGDAGFRSFEERLENRRKAVALSEAASPTKTATAGEYGDLAGAVGRLHRLPVRHLQPRHPGRGHGAALQGHRGRGDGRAPARPGRAGQQPQQQRQPGPGRRRPGGDHRRRRATRTPRPPGTTSPSGPGARRPCPPP